MDDVRWLRTDHRRNADGVHYIQQPDQELDVLPEPRAFSFDNGK
jgi:hypothetical protein